MKRIVILFMSLAFAVSVKAQIAEWLIHPVYDNIGMATGTDAVVTDSAGVKTVWSLDGKRLISTSNYLYPFKEKLALSARPGSSLITGIYKEDGSALLLDNCFIARQYPYYSNGKLLVQKDGLYRFVDRDGVMGVGKYFKAYPYSNGFAVCDIWLNFEKKKDPRHLLLDLDGAAVMFFFNGKSFSPDDLEFISSVNDEETGVLVIKRKVYFFDASDRSLAPVFASEDESNLKNQAKLEDDLVRGLVRQADSTWTLSAKCGKVGRVSIHFDTMLRPLSITRNGETYEYAVKVEPKKEYASPLRYNAVGGEYGIFWEKKEILPPQFEEFRTCFGDCALVKLNGKFGMLKVHKDAEFRLKMNKGDDIAFRHQKFETTIRADFPTIISADNTTLEINQETGCDLDRTSKEAKNTDSGNFVQYDCVLNIPSSLPDELTEIEYPVQIMYDGLKSPVFPFKVKAWHYKYFVVDVDDSQTALENGTVSFVFNINAERMANDRIYPTTVNIQADTLGYELEKMSETRFKCKVFALSEGVNNIVVQILEQGCPPAAFPFEVEYFKPVEKTRNTPAEEERVVIKKKPKSSAKKTTPFVIMD